MELPEKISALLQPYLKDGELFVVDVRVGASKIRNKVVILIDSDNGIGIDDLGEISRGIAEDLEEVMPDAYTLEVSSPGVDTPLSFPRMYKKNVGRTLKVTYGEGEIIKGELTDATDESFTIQPEKSKKQKETPEPRTFSYGDVSEVKVIVSFK